MGFNSRQYSVYGMLEISDSVIRVISCSGCGKRLKWMPESGIKKSISNDYSQPESRQS